ncbi:hypothetical protein EVAR_20223_1 [Eumeta japonica]|uniref:Mariner Mos1 transposase n=1 Tax=Eumeta variegata TaxID=151549 RepID=A0A4C1W8I9_EUMVA|nr:hypothetical protein EVAR_20223_1 [Eumeta japonica]
MEDFNTKLDKRKIDELEMSSNSNLLHEVDVWWDAKGIIRYELLPPGKDSDLYCQQLMRLKQEVEKKRLELVQQKSVDRERPQRARRARAADTTLIQLIVINCGGRRRNLSNVFKRSFALGDRGPAVFFDHSAPCQRVMLLNVL